MFICQQALMSSVTIRPSIHIHAAHSRTDYRHSIFAVLIYLTQCCIQPPYTWKVLAYGESRAGQLWIRGLELPHPLLVVRWTVNSVYAEHLWPTAQRQKTEWRSKDTLPTGVGLHGLPQQQWFTRGHKRSVCPLYRA